ncbi:serine/threonine-protein kinase [Deltaproteobacteria bacterium IMCC39524]|nr:serine/threonine-protein kinase [Deltaproteobacteria bacterium IMCC39524]
MAKVSAATYFSTVTGLWSILQIFTYFEGSTFKKIVGPYWGALYGCPVLVALLIACLHTKRYYQLGKKEEELSGDENDLRLPALNNGVKYLDRFQIKANLSREGLTSVYVAWDEAATPHREVVLKLLKLDVRDKSANQFIRRELEICKKLKSYNLHGLIKIHEVHWLSNKQGAFIVQDYLGTSRSLHDILLAEGQLEVERALTIILQLCDGIAGLHKNKIVHCDIKPLNILINDAGEPIIIDFGTARYFGEIIGPDDMRVSFPYTDPALTANEPADEKSDVYSLAVTLTHMLNGLPDKIREEGNPTKVLGRSSEQKDIPNMGIQHLDSSLVICIASALRQEGYKPTLTIDMFKTEISQIITTMDFSSE